MALTIWRLDASCGKSVWRRLYRNSLRIRFQVRQQIPDAKYRCLYGCGWKYKHSGEIGYRKVGFAILTNKGQWVFRFARDRGFGISVQKKGQVRLGSDLQEKPNVKSNWPMLKGQVRQLVIDVTIEDHEFDIFGGTVGNDGEQSKSVEHVKNKPQREDIPRSNVLVSTCNRPFRTADSFFTFESAQTQVLPVPGECNDIIPKGIELNAMPTLLQVA